MSLDILALRRKQVDQDHDHNAGEGDQETNERCWGTYVAGGCRWRSDTGHRCRCGLGDDQAAGRQKQQDDQIPCVIHSVILPEQELLGEQLSDHFRRPYPEGVRSNGLPEP